MPTIQELREERAGLFGQMKAITDAAEKENRPLSNEERATWDNHDKALDSLGDQIAKLEKDAERAAKVKQVGDMLKQSAGRKTDATASLPVESKPATGSAAVVKAAFRNFLANGASMLLPEERAALQADVAASGGALTMPEEFRAQLIQFVNNLLFMRQLGTVLNTNAQSLGFPSLENDPADANWTGELSIGTEDSTMSFGKRMLTPHDLAKSIKISRNLLRESAINVEALVNERLSYKFAVTEEQAFMTGTGAQQPLGVFVAHAAGITTGRDTSAASQTAIAADDLINTKYSLKAQYMMSSSLRWIMHRDTVKAVRKLKDGNGQYLWQAGIGSTPDSILEVPYVMSEYAPNTFTSGLYVALIGDLKNYWIADGMQMEMQRLDELYAATNQVGIVGRRKVDAMPVLAEAFARLKLA